MSWDKFSDIYGWELNFMNPSQLEDVKFWYNLAIETGGPILEVAAGNGRITKHLLKTGFDIYALELSKNMVKKLNKLNYKNLTVIHADMKNFEINKKFNLIIVGYFSFQQLLTLEEQLTFLINAKKHLTKDGILGMDIYPCVCEGEDFSPLKRLYKRKFKEKTIEMFSSYTIDRLNLIKHWNDFYRIISDDGQITEEFYNNISLKECSPDFMDLLVLKANMKILKKYGSFNKSEITNKSQNILYLIGK